MNGSKNHTNTAKPDILRYAGVDINYDVDIQIENSSN
jgi:hypothetical protein